MICESCNNKFTQDASSPVGLCPACWDRYRRECERCGEEFDGEHWSGTNGLCPNCFNIPESCQEEWYPSPEGHGESYDVWRLRMANNRRAEIEDCNP